MKTGPCIGELQGERVISQRLRHDDDESRGIVDGLALVVRFESVQIRVYFSHTYLYRPNIDELLLGLAVFPSSHLIRKAILYRED